MLCLRSVLFSIVPLFAFASLASADPIEINQLTFSNPPSWLKKSQLQKVVDHAEKYLEWDIRKVEVFWHPDQAEFQKAHGFDASVLAFTRGTDHSVHIGPRVNATNFEAIFGHELTHVIVFQKYKSAIPKWLEEGLANYVGKAAKVDYPWLATQPPQQISTLGHPFKAVYTPGSPSVSAKYHYMASTAAIEMIASKCDLEQLLQLSVGKSLTSYFDTFCGIPDLDDEFKKWIKRKGGVH